MGILRRIFDSIVPGPAPPDEARALSHVENNFLWGWLSGGRAKSGVTVSHTNVLQLSPVFAAVYYLAQDVASLSLDVLVQRGPRNREKFPEHPAHGLLTMQPNGIHNAYVYHLVKTAHQALYGEAFSEIIRDNAFRPRELRVIHPDAVETLVDTVNYSLVYKINDAGGPRKVPAHNMVHLRGLSLDGINGMSPVEYARETFGFSLAAQQNAASFYANGAQLDGAIEVPGEVTPEFYERFMAGWRRNYAGTNSKNKVALLEQGMKYLPIGMTAIDSQMIQSLKITNEDAARMFRMPLHMLSSLERATFNNVEQLSADYVTYTLRPLIKQREHEYSLKLLTEEEKKRGDTFIRYNLNSLLRGDTKTRGEFYRVQFMTGALSPNDIRDLEGMNAREGGDYYYTPMNMDSSGPNNRKEYEN